MKEIMFNSQVSTSFEQSQRLLDLGLKPETADMYYFWKGGNDYRLKVDVGNNPLKYNMDKTYIPAWSLHRLLYLIPDSVKDYYLTVYSGYVITYNSLCGSSYEFCKEFNESLDIYDNIIDCIEWLINEGYFNKDLKQ